MKLPRELISQFAKITKDEESRKETTVYGTIVERDGIQYVQLDGSDHLTPVATTVNMAAGERVMVLLKNHTAIVTGNVTSPAVNKGDVSSITQGAEKTATNFIKSDTNGLIFGDHTVNTLLYNLLLASSGAVIRKGSANIAKFADELIEMGDSETTVNLYSQALYYYIKGEACKPYHTAGDSITLEWHGAGYVSDSSAKVYFTIPLSKPLVGVDAASVTSVSGLKVRQNSNYTHGSSSSAYATPTAYSTKLLKDSGMVAIVATFSDVTNAVNESPCGITASIKITFS